MVESDEGKPAPKIEIDENTYKSESIVGFLNPVVAKVKAEFPPFDWGEPPNYAGL